jgi:PAS domain S-box-containing protein
MRSVAEPAKVQESAHPRRRLVILAAASLMGPAMNFIQAHREVTKVVAVGGATLFLLVILRLRGLMVDISEHRRTERQLQEAEAKYRSLVEHLPAIVYEAEFGKDGRWTYVSPQIEEILGFSRHEWMSRPQLWHEQLHPEDRAHAFGDELKVLETGQRLRTEYRIRAADGHLVWIREEAEMLKDESGQPLYLQGVMFDVSDQKRAEETLKGALEKETEASNHLRSLQEMQNSFLEAVSHDLRTPLTSILGAALTLDREELSLSSEDGADLVHRIAVNAQKLNRLLVDLLDLDRLTRGIMEPRRKWVDVRAVVLALVAECNLEGHPLHVSTEPVFANVDSAQVERIVENLVTNAVRYTPIGTSIWVGMTAWNRGALITVEDAGPGIAAGIRQRIFEPFRQGDQLIPHSPGVGIGLSLVRRFAELHGGRAWADERAGGGASFRVYLPNQGTQENETESGLPGPALAVGSP